MSLVGYVAVLELIDTRVYTNRHACIHKQTRVYTQTAVNLDLDVKSPAWPMLHGDPIF